MDSRQQKKKKECLFLAAWRGNGCFAKLILLQWSAESLELQKQQGARTSRRFEIWSQVGELWSIYGLMGWDCYNWLIIFVVLSKTKTGELSEDFSKFPNLWLPKTWFCKNIQISRQCSQKSKNSCKNIEINLNVLLIKLVNFQDFQQRVNYF